MTRKQQFSPWYWNWKAIIGELVATCLLVFFGCMTCIPLDGVNPNPPLYSCIGFGMMILMNVQTFAHISGAFMNPIISLIAVIWGKISISFGIILSIAQCLGAILGYGILMELSPVNLIAGGICVNQPHEEHSLLQSLVIEILFTTALSLAICSLWDPENEDKTESIPLKFGLIVVGLAIAGGPLNGMSMNPAKSLGSAVWTKKWTAHWVYWVGPSIGAVLGTLFYMYVLMTVKKSKEPKMLALNSETNPENYAYN